MCRHGLELEPGGKLPINHERGEPAKRPRAKHKNVRSISWTTARGELLVCIGHGDRQGRGLGDDLTHEKDSRGQHLDIIEAPQSAAAAGRRVARL